MKKLLIFPILFLLSCSTEPENTPIDLDYMIFQQLHYDTAMYCDSKPDNTCIESTEANQSGVKVVDYLVMNKINTNYISSQMIINDYTSNLESWDVGYFSPYCILNRELYISQNEDIVEFGYLPVNCQFKKLSYKKIDFDENNNLLNLYDDVLPDTTIYLTNSIILHYDWCKY